MSAQANGESTLARLRDPHVTAEATRRLVTMLLAEDEVLGVATVLDLLAGPPRLKPTRGLLIDPADDARRRWECRVAAAAALLESPTAARVAGELADELRADPELASDVLAIATPYASVRSSFEL